MRKSVLINGVSGGVEKDVQVIKNPRPGVVQVGGINQFLLCRLCVVDYVFHSITTNQDSCLGINKTPCNH